MALTDAEKRRRKLRRDLYASCLKVMAQGSDALLNDGAFSREEISLITILARTADMLQSRIGVESGDKRNGDSD